MKSATKDKVTFAGDLWWLHCNTYLAKATENCEDIHVYPFKNGLPGKAMKHNLNVSDILTSIEVVSFMNLYI